MEGVNLGEMKENKAGGHLKKLNEEKDRKKKGKRQLWNEIKENNLKQEWWKYDFAGPLLDFSST